MTTTLSNTGPRTEGVHHVGLTVPDLVAARVFFVEALGFEQVGERPEYPAVFLSDSATMITLWQAENADTAIPFDRRRVIGLHHLALRLADTSTLHLQSAAFSPHGSRPPRQHATPDLDLA